MDSKTIPILEFDPTPEAIIEPTKVLQRKDAPDHCVLCFFQDVINKFIAEGTVKLVNVHKSELGDHPLYEICYLDRRLAIIHPGIGAPLAASLLEEVIAIGCRKFIACGGAGVLDSDIACGNIILPISAVRDEGTSYHYLPASREVEASPEAVAAIETVLKKHGINYIEAKTWTTDGIYRETRAKAERRREEGCLTVEMEAAAFFAVAQFRGVSFAQMLYGGDDLGGAEWDHRDWQGKGTVREQLFWLAAEACLRL